MYIYVTLFLFLWIQVLITPEEQEEQENEILSAVSKKYIDHRFYEGEKKSKRLCFIFIFYFSLIQKNLIK